MGFAGLILDHDDTVVQSMEQLHYPSLCHTLAILRPGEHVTLDEYKQACADPGFEPYCRRRFGFTDEEMAFELQDWQAYTRDRIPDVYEGLAPLLLRFRQAHGRICVVTHSAEELVRRDYRHHFGFEPDAVYDLTYTPQKPHPAPVRDYMRRAGLRPEQCLVVDDLSPGLEMARAAGTAFAYAAWGRPASSVDAWMRAHTPAVLEQVSDLERLLFE